ncbi:hypothetical protein ACOSQ3_017573 [Xanthoceras sorbifolium]
MKKKRFGEATTLLNVRVKINNKFFFKLVSFRVRYNLTEERSVNATERQSPVHHLARLQLPIGGGSDRSRTPPSEPAPRSTLGRRNSELPSVNQDEAPPRVRSHQQLRPQEPVDRRREKHHSKQQPRAGPIAPHREKRRSRSAREAKPKILSCQATF